MVTDGEALLAAVREEPFDLARLLVYADWLAEGGGDDTRIRGCIAGLQAAEAVWGGERSATFERVDSELHTLDPVTRRVFAVACCRRTTTWGKFLDPAYVDAVEVGWLFACGLADDISLTAAREAALTAARETALRPGRETARGIAWSAALPGALAAARATAKDAAAAGATAAAWSAAKNAAWSSAKTAARDGEHGHQLAMLEAIREATS